MQASWNIAWLHRHALQGFWAAAHITKRFSEDQIRSLRPLGLKAVPKAFILNAGRLYSTYAHGILLSRSLWSSLPAARECFHCLSACAPGITFRSPRVPRTHSIIMFMCVGLNSRWWPVRQFPIGLAANKTRRWSRFDSRAPTQLLPLISWVMRARIFERLWTYTV